MAASDLLITQPSKAFSEELNIFHNTFGEKSQAGVEKQKLKEADVTAAFHTY